MSVNFAALSVNAIGFTIALAWNDAVSKIVKSRFPFPDGKNAARASLVYAIVVTLIVVFVVWVIDHTRSYVRQNRANKRVGNSEPEGQELPNTSPKTLPLPTSQPIIRLRRDRYADAGVW